MKSRREKKEKLGTKKEKASSDVGSFEGDRRKGKENEDPPGAH